MFDQEDFSLIIKIVLGVLSIVVGYCGYLFLPDIMNKEREIVKNSHQYVEASQSRLMKFADEYNDTKIKIKLYESSEGDYADLITDYKNQKSILLESIKMEVVKIPEDAIPESVFKILEEE
jgi:hypothetical protein